MTELFITQQTATEYRVEVTERGAERGTSKSCVLKAYNSNKIKNTPSVLSTTLYNTSNQYKSCTYSQYVQRSTHLQRVTLSEHNVGYGVKFISSSTRMFEGHVITNMF